MIGPNLQARQGLDGHSVLQTGICNQLGVAGDDHKIGLVVVTPGRCVGNQDRRHPFLLSQQFHHRRQVDQAVGHVVDDGPIGFDLLLVDPQGLHCHQMHGDGVGGKRIDAEHVKLLRRVALQVQSTVSQTVRNLGLGVGEVPKIFFGNVQHRWHQLINAVVVCFAAIGGQHPNAQTQNTHIDGGSLLGIKIQYPRYASAWPKVADGFGAQLGVGVLPAMADGAVVEVA